MTAKHLGLIWGMIGLITLAWFISPIYSFYAHRGDLPFPPTGWQSLPEGEIPLHQNILDARYRSAAERTARLMEQHRAVIGAPSLSAAVLIDGELVWQAATGWADLATGKAATPDSVYRVGSTSKAITATALARLVDRGTLGLDDPITKYLGAVPRPDWKNISFRMLASHMSGIPHYKDNSELTGLYRSVAMDTAYADVRDAVSLFDESDLLFPPGTDFEYSSPGTVLLGAAMSAADGRPYREIIAEEVLQPANAGSVIVSPTRASGKDDFATPYYHEGDRYRIWRDVDMTHRLPGGGYAATASDLARIGWLHLKPGFIKPQTRDIFWTPQRLANGETNEQDYALGWRWREWEVEGAGLARNANHGGVSRGGQAWLLVFPDHDMVIAFAMNGRTTEFHEFGMFYEEIFREFVVAKREVSGN